MKDRGLSQAGLAAMSGNTEMTISRVCRGKVTPSVVTLVRIAEALDVPVDRLVGHDSR